METKNQPLFNLKPVVTQPLSSSNDDGPKPVVTQPDNNLLTREPEPVFSPPPAALRETSGAPLAVVTTPLTPELVKAPENTASSTIFTAYNPYTASTQEPASFVHEATPEAPQTDISGVTILPEPETPAEIIQQAIIEKPQAWAEPITPVAPLPIVEEPSNALEYQLNDTYTPEQLVQPEPQPVAAAPAPTTAVYQHENAELQAIIQEHAEWVNTEGKSGRRANFRQADLRQVQLANAFLPEASFRGADLTQANLSGCDLRGADLSEAILTGTNLDHANLGGAILPRTNLQTANLQGADFQGADLSSAILAGGHFTQLNLANAILLEADLQGVNMPATQFSGANLRGARLNGADLSGSDFSYANCRDTDFSQAILDGALFQGASLRNATVQGASLIGTDLSNAAEGSTDNRQESVQLEKEQLQQEWTKLRAEQVLYQQQFQSVQQREMALLSDRQQVEMARREVKSQQEQIASLARQADEILQRHRKHDSAVRILGLIWFILTVLMVGGVLLLVQALDIRTLNMVELSILFGGCGIVLLLFIYTTVRSIRLSSNVHKLVKLHDQLAQVAQ